MTDSDRVIARARAAVRGGDRADFWVHDLTVHAEAHESIARDLRAAAELLPLYAAELDKKRERSA